MFLAQFCIARLLWGAKGVGDHPQSLVQALGDIFARVTASLRTHQIRRRVHTRASDALGTLKTSTAVSWQTSGKFQNVLLKFLRRSYAMPWQGARKLRTRLWLPRWCRGCEQARERKASERAFISRNQGSGDVPSPRG